MMKRIVTSLITLALSVGMIQGLSLYFNNRVTYLAPSSFEGVDFYTANVTQVYEEIDIDDPFDFYVKRIRFSAVLTSGPQRNTEVLINQGFDERMLLELYPIRVNDRIVVYRSMQGSFVLYNLIGLQRTQSLIFLIALFAVALVVFGRLKGLNALVALGLSLYVISHVLIPAVLAQQNLILVTLLSGLLITVFSFLLIAGYTRKSLAAILGTFGGILSAAWLAHTMMNLMRMSGILTQEYAFLVYNIRELQIDLRGVLFMGIIIGAVGAIMDVSMSIASALEEITHKNAQLSVRDLFKSGISIGQDVMGTMANTLILAYVGSSFSTLILLVVNPQPLEMIINSEYVAAEILQAIAGSMGLLLAIPVTALISALLFKGRQLQS